MLADTEVGRTARPVLGWPAAPPSSAQVPVLPSADCSDCLLTMVP